MKSENIVKKRKKYRFINRKHYQPSEVDKERMRLVKRLYDEYGTLSKVGSLLKLTRERVRQLLNKGEKYKLFTYELTRDRVLGEAVNRISKERLRDLIFTTKNQFDISSILEIDMHLLQRLMKYYNIDLESYKQDARYKKCISQYSEMVSQIGYHPSTTVMQRNKEWRKIWVKIDRLWGSFDNFRREFGIQKPKHKMHPNTIVAWRLSKEKRMAKKKEKVSNVYKLVKNSGPIGCLKISKQTGYRRQNVNIYLNQLISSGVIQRIGEGVKTLYIPVSN